MLSSSVTMIPTYEVKAGDESFKDSVSKNR